MRRIISLAVLCFALGGLNVLGDTVHLTDGTTITGRVIDQGDKYWIKGDDGETHMIDKTSVSSVSKESPSAVPGAGAAPVSSGNFATVKYKADHCETPANALTLWQAFIDGKPSESDLKAAKAEVAHWQEVLEGQGEKINGKWVWGEEHEQLIKKVSDLLTEGTEALNSNQTLVGIAKYEEAVKLYPNSFEANFELGFYNLDKGIGAGRNNAKIDDGVRSMETAVKLRPTCAAAISDLAVGYSFKQKYMLSVMTAYKAAKLEDSKEIIQNLVNAIAAAPPGLQNNSEIKPVLQETVLLADKYGISKSSKWEWVRPDDWNKPKVAEGTEKSRAEPRRNKDGEEEDPAKDAAPGPFGEGTGFFISSTGHILTNRHVAKPGDYLLVRMADNSVRMAKRVVIDDQQDMAVIKIDVAAPVPFVRLAGYDHPAVGADVAVFGFPLLDRFGFYSSVKMTRGIVTAWDKQNRLCDVTVDAIVNPGNSGGPMIDHHGNLLALTAMKTISDTGMVTTYGLGYSTERVRKFLDRQKAKLTDAKLEDGKDDGAVLDNEELAQKLTPCTVCILMCKGTPPEVSSAGDVQMPKR